MTKKENPDFKLVAQNKNAYRNFEILDTLEVGIVLKGNEVKSIRKGNVNLRDSFAKYEKNSLWLMNCHVSPYEQANTFYKIDATRNRKLLLHESELKRWVAKVQQKGLAITVTKLYFKKNLLKLQIALGKPKKIHDKRNDLKEKSISREMNRSSKRL
jgi:SsrA-binding protein